jgi:hypothetical protein
MNKAKFGWLLAGILFGAVAVMGYQLISDSRPTKPVILAPETHGAHAKPGPGQVLEVWIEDLLLWETMREKDRKLDHPGMVISVSQQQSVLWISAAHKFKVIGLEPSKDAPPDPFFRQFSKKTAAERDEWSNQVSSGPARREANPGRGKAFSYKATIALESGRIIDPHIMTVE